MATSDQTPTVINISRTRGDTFPFIFTVQDSSGNPINITSYTFLLSVDIVADPVDDSGQLLQITGTIADGPNGKVQFTPSANDADQVPSTYYYDVQMKDTVDAIRTIAKGTWIVEQDITKDT